MSNYPAASSWSVLLFSWWVKEREFQQGGGQFLSTNMQLTRLVRENGLF